MKRAMFQEENAGKKVQCSLCAHRCLIPDGHRGICAVRENHDGVLYSLVYDKIIARNVDPIEKKPLFHFLPASLSYSVATPGCNFRCKHCQNADISQLPRDRDGLVMGDAVAPEQIVAAARVTGCASISYTYTEPTIYFEIAHDTAKLAVQAGLRQLAEFIRSVGEDVPWHVSRFHPTYQLTDQPGTPVKTLQRARQIGLESGLRYVYEGNVPGEGEETTCWSCKKSLVRRTGFFVEANNLREGRCPSCGAVIDGVWA